MQLIKELLAEAQEVNVNDVNWPDQEIEEGQHVVGEANDDLRCLWGLMEAYRLKMNALAEEHDTLCDGDCDALGDDDKVRHAALMAKAEILGRRMNLVKKIFWTAVREDFDELSDKDSIGIGQGFRVYWEVRSPRIGGIEIIGVGLGDLLR